MTTSDGTWPRLWRTPRARRWSLFLIVSAVLLLMGFYTVTEPAHLAHSDALGAADWAGYAVCHRITERTFMINGRQMPLCARCTGMYLGAAFTLLALALAGRFRRSDLPRLPLLLTLLGFIGVMGIDGLNSYSHFFPNAPHLYEPQNWLRLLTGMGTGLAMGIIIAPALSQTLWREQQYTAPITSWSELAALVTLALVGVFLVLSNQPTVLYVLSLVSTAGLLFIVTSLNTIILLILLRKDAQAGSWRETAVPLAVGFLLAVIELGSISLLRFSLTGTMTGFPGL